MWPRAPGAFPTASPPTSLTQWSEATIRLFAGPQDGAPAQGGSPVRRRGDFVLVGDQEHGSAVLRQGTDGVQDTVQRERVDAGIRLVEDGEPGAHREDGSQFHAFPLATAQGGVDGSLEIPFRRKAHHEETFFRRWAGARGPTLAQFHVFLDGQSLEPGRFLPGEGDASYRAIGDGEGGDVLIEIVCSINHWRMNSSDCRDSRGILS